MERRYRVRFRLAPGQVVSQPIRATSAAKAIEKVLEMYGPDCDPVYVPGPRRSRKPDATHQLLDTLWKQWLRAAE